MFCRRSNCAVTSGKKLEPFLACLISQWKSMFQSVVKDSFLPGFGTKQAHFFSLTPWFASRHFLCHAVCSMWSTWRFAHFPDVTLASNMVCLGQQKITYLDEENDPSWPLTWPRCWKTLTFSWRCLFALLEWGQCLLFVRYYVDKEKVLKKKKTNSSRREAVNCSWRFSSWSWKSAKSDPNTSITC